MGYELSIRRILNPAAPAHLFETMAFSLAGGARLDTVGMWRCGTWAEAEAMHKAVAAELQRSVNG